MKDFDALLDGVLSEDAAAEPREGFEARVMAQVGAASPAASRRWMFAAWAGGLAVAAVAVVLVVLLPGRHELRTVRHDGLAASVGSKLPSGAKAPSASTTDGILRLRSGQASEAVPLSKTRPRSGGTARRVNTEITVAAAAHEETRLPKLDVFPSPAPTDVFPTPVANNEGRDAAAALSSPKAAEALLELQKEQEGPIQVAAIVIAPLNPER